jgi:hypothetical protein
MDSDFQNIDPITYEPIHKDKAVSIHKQVYDANSLSETIIYSYIRNEIATIRYKKLDISL